MSDGDDLGAARGSAPDPSGGGHPGAEAGAVAARQDYLDFFAAEFPLVVRFVMLDGADHHKAQDCAQHAFLKGWQRVLDGRWGTVGEPRAWIRTVALRHHRSSYRPCPEIPVQRLPDAIAPGPGHAELTGQERDLVAVLQVLPEDVRTVLAFHLDDISNSVIAAHLGVTEQRVRDLLKRARRNLKKHLTTPERPAGAVGGADTADREGRRER
ncbi:sigma-70 family RNA polymerase sigma factor [Actinomadura chibensis]|uniref:Sigma-70 family RNA polymerase sigma factor n=1 Tax=Actinomadura chibensis TaxID=392828 RepID=A0A5D0NDE7_9ACTN|nr:sigma-70 family RNA polymerase sigma factor [Actinomadura chibensis]TYB42251.1 sigma-70 family RNA polymerase sigma factor [Actinomadura chibensis]